MNGTREYGKGRCEQFNVRVTPEEKEKIFVLAKRHNMTTHEYIRYVMNNTFTLAGM